MFLYVGSYLLFYEFECSTRMLSLCVILHTMWSGKSLQMLGILPFGMLCFYSINMRFVKNSVGSVMLLGIVV